jgi:hypothetical protein
MEFAQSISVRLPQIPLFFHNFNSLGFSTKILTIYSGELEKTLLNSNILMKFYLERNANLLSGAKNSLNLLSSYYNGCGTSHQEIIFHLRIIIKLTNRYY